MRCSAVQCSAVQFPVFKKLFVYKLRCLDHLSVQGFSLLAIDETAKTALHYGARSHLQDEDVQEGEEEQAEEVEMKMRVCLIM